MQITYKVKNSKATSNSNKSIIKMHAIARVYGYKMTGSDYLLERILIRKTGFTLKKLALYIVSNSLIQSDLTDEYTVLFRGKIDSFANLLTYGDGTVKGSHILLDAFWDRRK